MRKLFDIFCIILLTGLILGCSFFVSTPRTARIMVRGPGNQINELSFSLDDPLEPQKDIRLSDRYALELDLQWLWYEKDDIALVETDAFEGSIAPLTPWVLCKYRF